MSNITIFNFEDHTLNTVILDGEIWFPATALAKVLNYGNPRQAISTHVDEKDVQKLDALTKGGNQSTNYVNESGMYALIFGSTKPEAKRFKRWVTSEVLPTIRKTGSYHAQDVTPAKPFGEYSDADLQHLKHVYTVPQLAKALHTSEAKAVKRLCDSYPENQPTQQALFADQSVPAHIQKALDQFWQTISQLDLEQINHSNDPKMLAINLPEVYRQAGDKLPPKNRMLSALKNSIMPRFYESNHAINSRIKGQTVKTWVFVMPNDKEA